MISRVLVVDDHIHLAENIAEILDGEGYQTMVAGSAEQALGLLEAERVDALITDYRLPGLSGAQLITEIRRRGRAIPAIVMTAYSDDHTLADARAAGALDVLGKPVALARLLQMIAALRNGKD